jgi:hypothetical protein
MLRGAAALWCLVASPPLRLKPLMAASGGGTVTGAHGTAPANQPPDAVCGRSG